MKSNWLLNPGDLIPIPSVRDEITHATISNVLKRQEIEFKEVLSQHLPNGWTPEELKRRCKLESVQGDPVKTLYLDDKPILEIHPLEFGPVENRGGSWVQTITQKFRRL